MKLKWFLVVAAAVGLIRISDASGALVDITRPGDPTKLVSGANQNDGDDGPPPGAEGVENAINDTGQKYLNFLDINSGFAVTPSASGGNPVIGLRLYTANDSEERDPASVQLFGSNGNLDGPWTAIYSGNIALPAGRNDGGGAVVIPPVGNLTAVHQEISFTNATAYSHYLVVFPTLKDANAANSMQIAEVELLAVPEPSLIAGVLIACAGLATRRR